MVEALEKRMSLAEFLAWEDGSDRRYELVSGAVYRLPIPMTAHGMIVTTLGAMLHERVESAPCRVVMGGGIVPPHRTDTFYSADLVVSCGPLDPRAQAIAAPLVVAEILLPETAVHDRGTKVPDYMRMAPIREIVLVDSCERRAEVWHRAGEARWLFYDLRGDAVIRLDSIAAEIPLAAVYENVVL